MDEIIFRYAKFVGAVVFCIIVIGWIITLILPNDRQVPPKLLGCYSDHRIGTVTINKEEIRFNGQKSRFISKYAYSRDNIGSRIEVELPISLDTNDGVNMDFVLGGPRKFIRIRDTNDISIIITSNDFEEVKFIKELC